MVLFAFKFFKVQFKERPVKKLLWTAVQPAHENTQILANFSAKGLDDLIDYANFTILQTVLNFKF